MENTYEEEKAEYFEIVDSLVSEMLRDSRRSKDLLNLDLALGRSLSKEWVGIKDYLLLDLIVWEDYPQAHKV